MITADHEVMEKTQSAADRKLYFVWGGVFTGMDFHNLQPGAEESYGPFHSEEDALTVWSDKTRRNVDVAQHRMFILAVPRPPLGRQ